MRAWFFRCLLSVLISGSSAARCWVSLSPGSPSYPPVQIAMHNVRVHLAEGIILDVRQPARRDDQPEGE